MLHEIKTLTGYTIKATDGETGPIHALLFDDREWIVRYLAVDMGGWFSDRKVLIGPDSLGQPDWTRDELPVTLTREQVENSPTLNVIQPYAHQMESIDVATVSVPVAAPAGAFFPSPTGVTPAEASKVAAVKEKYPIETAIAQSDNAHLRSTHEVTGYNIQAQDGSIGHIEDFLVDDQQWTIQYIVVDTRNWLPGGEKVLLTPVSLKTINWAERNVYVDLPQETIRNSPKYNTTEPIAAVGSRWIEYYKKLGLNINNN